MDTIWDRVIIANILFLVLKLLEVQSYQKLSHSTFGAVNEVPDIDAFQRINSIEQ